MSSPFPGMDPYLESPARWRGVHTHFISDLTYQLNRQLPSGLIAQVEERCYILPREKDIYPDSLIARSPLANGHAGSRTPAAVGGATAVVAAPANPNPSGLPLVFELPGREIKEPYVEIVTADAEERVVTVIELLSPSNKVPGTHGQDDYVRKRESLLDSYSHLLEIDLLRGGAHTVTLDRARIAAQKPFDYVICLHRAGAARQRFECWPFGLRERVPDISVPLTPGLPDLTVDLQAVLDNVYDRGAYGARLLYAAEPEPALSASDAAWAAALLREKGLRT